MSRSARPGAMQRLTALLVLLVVLAGCGGAPAASGSPTATAPPTPSAVAPSDPSPSDPAASGPAASPDGAGPPASPAGGADAAAGLVAALGEAGAEVGSTGSFVTDPIGGEGIGLCVDGQVVNVYVFPTVEEREAVASRIDPEDPSNLGTAIIDWAGTPRFWQADRVLVLYLGADPAVEAGLTSVLGDPFARGEGRPPLPGPDLNAC